MLIPLKEILRIEKAKPFNFMPGSGMSIEIHMASADKPVLFGGMLRRNLIYDQLMEGWQAAQRAIQHRSSSSNMEATPSTSQGDVRSRAGSHRQASSSHSEAGESDSESAC
nr:GRAM domain-containing protein 4-like [Lytechinus pictus]